MDPSSDPSRDEYGLPPVDIEIPDDARDLDRDVQAYHRELRAQRRRVRLNRLAGPLIRRSVVIPLVAACLALTLLSGTLLTVVAGRHQAGPLIATPRAAAPQPTAPGTASPGRLPDAQVSLDGKQVSLRSLVPAVLAWVPQYCSCFIPALRQLSRQTARAHVRMYLVGTDRVAQELPVLAMRVGQRGSQVLNDPTDALGLRYSPVGLTVILADRDGTVGAVIRRLPVPDRQVAAALPALASPGPAAGRGTQPPGQPTPRTT